MFSMLKIEDNIIWAKTYDCSLFCQDILRNMETPILSQDVRDDAWHNIFEGYEQDGQSQLHLNSDKFEKV